MLSGASAGVIGVDSKGNVSILNRSAEKLIGRTESEALGQPLTEVLPELVGTMAAVQSGASRRIRSPSAETIANAIYRCALQASSQADSDRGYVVTLDDITELVAAQRTSAWADVARRIAHEIRIP